MQSIDEITPQEALLQKSLRKTWLKKLKEIAQSFQDLNNDFLKMENSSSIRISIRIRSNNLLEKLMQTRKY